MSEVSGIELEKEDNCIEDYEEYTNRMQEIWGYDQSYIETARSYRTNSI